MRAEFSRPTRSVRELGRALGAEEPDLDSIDRNRPSGVPKTGTPLLRRLFSEQPKAFIVSNLHKVTAWRPACDSSRHYGYRNSKL